MHIGVSMGRKHTKRRIEKDSLIQGGIRRHTKPFRHGFGRIFTIANSRTIRKDGRLVLSRIENALKASTLVKGIGTHASSADGSGHEGIGTIDITDTNGHVGVRRMHQEQEEEQCRSNGPKR